MRVAGVAALIVAKAHKLGERMRDAPRRMEPKDALDMLRLLRATQTDRLAETVQRLFADPRAGDVTREAMSFLRALFTDPDAPGLVLVGEAVGRLDDPAMVRASTRSLVDELLTAAT